MITVPRKILLTDETLEIGSALSVRITTDNQWSRASSATSLNLATN
jgi:hypothetical protein